MSHQLIRRLTIANNERRSDFESSSPSSLLPFLQTHHLSSLHQHSSTTTTTTSTKVVNTNNNPCNNHFKTKHCPSSSSFPCFDRIRCNFVHVSCGGCFTKHNKCCLVDPMSSLVTATRLLASPDNRFKRNNGGQQKLQELQREVSVLQNLLNQEEKVREVLQQVYNRKAGMPFTIPDNLPPKMKEVLSELVMVEDEIVGLETQIEQLRKDVKTEQEASKEVKSKQSFQLRNASGTKHNQQQRSSNNNASNDQPNVYETRALHFISKAINGDYSLTDFTINEKNTNIGIKSPLNGGGNLSPYIQPAKQSGLQENRVPKRSGILNNPTASPLRNFRDPTPFKPKERSTGEARVDPPQKSISGPAKLEESSGTKWQPNKLSENIMKCLILIYVRLMRISRQSELEKSGPISRSMYSSLSFRTEPGVSLSTSLMKESKQQDPYGIFEIEGAIPRDIGPYKNLVVFSSSCLDPKYVSNSSSIPLFQKLKGLFNSLQKADLRSLTDHQKLAFWINIYNACIMHGFLKFSVPSTPEKLLNLLNKATLNVGGKVVNAQAIERCILRKPTMLSSKEGKEAIIHELYGLQTINPNVIFTLCCGTRSSPAVRIYTGEGVTSELEKSKLEYLQASISVTNSRKILLPELLIQNMNDFAKDLDSLVEWVCHQLPTSGSLRKSIVDCFRGNSNSGRISNAINVDKMPYDFECQYLLQV